MKLKTKAKWTGVLLTAPYLAGFFLLFVIPFLISVTYTFTRGVGAMEFVGLANYADVLGSAAFRLAFYNTFRFLLLGVPLLMAVSLWLACMVNGRGRAKQVFRSIFLYPMVLPVASVVMFFQVFLAERGILNSLLTHMGSPFCWMAGFGNLLRGADLPLYLEELRLQHGPVSGRAACHPGGILRNRPAGRGRAGPDFPAHHAAASGAFYGVRAGDLHHEWV